MAPEFADHIFQTTSLSRRSLMTLMVGSALFAACGDDDDDDDGEEPADGGGDQPTDTAEESGGESGSPEADATEGEADATEEDAEETEPADDEEDAEGEPVQGGTLHMGFEGDQILSLDPPIVNFGTIAGELLPALFSSLVQFDETLAIQPDLAETFEVSDDGLNYTFNLREGLTFHNRDPLIADDIIYT